MTRLNPPPPAYVHDRPLRRDDVELPSYEPNPLFSNFTPDGKRAPPSDAAQAEAQTSNTDRNALQPLPLPQQQVLGRNPADNNKKKKPHPCAALFAFVFLVGFAVYFIYLFWKHQQDQNRVEREWELSLIHI